MCSTSDLLLSILSQVQLLKQQGSRVMPGTDTLDAGLGEQTTSVAILMYLNLRNPIGTYMYIIHQRSPSPPWIQEFREKGLKIWTLKAVSCNKGLGASSPRKLLKMSRVFSRSQDLVEFLQL